jgi:hypothetical protein
MAACASTHIILNSLQRVSLILMITTLFFSACSPLDKTITPTPIKTVTPIQVKSTWRFETIYQPKLLSAPGYGPGQHWLALDSKGYPHLVYGGDQLYYAWFDGTAWHYEIPDTHLGAGKLASLVLDRQDFPHIVHMVGNYDPMNHLTLIHTYQDSKGWKSETVDPDFCNGRDLDVQFDSQKRLSVIYSNSQMDPRHSIVYTKECIRSGSDANQIRFAQQVDGKWKIETVTESGMYPSLAYDAAGRLTHQLSGLGDRVAS